MLWAAFILGLAGSWHCVAMCGPIALLVPGLKHKKIQNAGLYLFGKLLAYLTIGSIFGLIPAFITSYKIQSIIAISAGVLMLILAVTPTLLNQIEKRGYKTFNFFFDFKNKLAKSLKKNKAEYSFYIGFLNGFMPCALVYMAALGALSQRTFIDATLFMLFFGIGTMPIMATFLGLSGFLQKFTSRYGSMIRNYSFAIIGIFILWKGIHNISTTIDPPKEGEQFEICETYSH